MNVENIIAQIDAKSIYNKEKALKYGEVFTPWKLINEMCDAFEKTDWLDPSKTWLDPCSGLEIYQLYWCKDW